MFKFELSDAKIAFKKFAWYNRISVINRLTGLFLHEFCHLVGAFFSVVFWPECMRIIAKYNEEEDSLSYRGYVRHSSYKAENLFDRIVLSYATILTTGAPIYGYMALLYLAYKAGCYPAILYLAMLYPSAGLSINDKKELASVIPFLFKNKPLYEVTINEQL